MLEYSSYFWTGLVKTAESWDVREGPHTHATLVSRSVGKPGPARLKVYNTVAALRARREQKLVRAGLDPHHYTNFTDNIPKPVSRKLVIGS
jgi:hypothetical protein